MTAYINTQTLEYPRHIGDLVLDLNGQYAAVVYVESPAYDAKTQTAYEVAPEHLSDGSWRMVWVVRDLTPEEIPFRPLDQPGNEPDDL